MGFKAQNFKLTENEKKIVEENINLIYSFADSFGIDAEEFWEPLSIGLVKAVHSYEKSNKKHKLSSYVYTQMKSEVLNFKKMLVAGNRIPIEKFVYYQSDYDTTYENLLVDRYCVEHDVVGKMFIQSLFTLLTPLEQYITKRLYQGYSLSEIKKSLPDYTYRKIDGAHKKIKRIFLHSYSQTREV